MERISELRTSAWPHRLAVALALVTFPLIWVGGLVTTYDAGMAVPDWPGTYGYNLFLYPWQAWLAAPWDLFIEHGHRLLGSLAGLISIVLVLATWRTNQRSSVRWMAMGALALVVLQGLLGGARVLLDERLAALIHACVGPLFFAYLAGLVVLTSRFWNENQPAEDRGGQRLMRSAWFVCGLAWAQLVVGAVVRHLPLTASPQLFRAALLLHLLFAGVLLFQIPLTSLAAWRTARLPKGPALLLSLAVVAQIALGIGTYVAKYSFPAWLGEYHFAASYVVQEKSLLQSLVTTAHVANGSLILFVSVWLAMQASRLFRVAGWQPAPLASWQIAAKVRAA